MFKQTNWHHLGEFSNGPTLEITSDIKKKLGRNLYLVSIDVLGYKPLVSTMVCMGEVTADLVADYAGQVVEDMNKNGVALTPLN